MTKRKQIRNQLGDYQRSEVLILLWNELTDKLRFVLENQLGYQLDDYLQNEVWKVLRMIKREPINLMLESYNSGVFRTIDYPIGSCIIGRLRTRLSIETSTIRMALYVWL